MSDQDWTIPVSGINNLSHVLTSEYKYHMIYPGDIIGQKLGQHEQIPQLLDKFVEKEQFYLVLDFIDGQDFSQEIQAKLLNEVEVISFLQEVLTILDFVHQQGVIHRDIKPNNLIRRSRDRKIFLIDFGAVKEIGTTILQSSFRSVPNSLYTQIIGTPGYMSPEQNNGKPIFSSDIYALGKTAIYALTGQTPTEWEQIEIDEAIYWQDNLNISQGLIKLLLRMISPNISERFISASQVINTLKPLLIVGKVLNKHYSVVEYINSEGITDNYIVQDLQADEYSLSFATKINLSSSEKISKKDAQKYIKNFIEKISKFDKNNQILLISDHFIHQNSYYLIQEYVPGKTIEQLIKNNAIFLEDTILKLIEDTALALNTCHNQKLIHGNIKPSSLIQSQARKQIILQNFNIFSESTNSFANKKTGHIKAQRDDIYSLGMTAIYALTGTSPKKLEKDPYTGQILWEKKVQVSRNLITLINKMICLDPERGYQSTEQVLRKVKTIKSRAKFPLWYVYFFSISLGLIGLLFMVAQWSQRTAILEFYKADIMLEEQQYWTAINYYDAGLKKIFKTKKQVEHYQQVWLKKATAFNRLGNHQAALDTCNKALKHYQSYQLWNCQGLALDSLARYDEAVFAYNKAIAINSEYLWLWNNRGEVYTKLGRFSKAIADFQKAISLNQQQSFVPWNNLGKLYYQQQKYQAAMVTYQKAIAIKQDYIPALIGLGNCYKAEKNYVSALEIYDQVIRIDNHAYEAWLGKGLVEESLQKYTAAAQTYQQALNIREDQEDGVVVEQALKRVLEQLNKD